MLLISSQKAIWLNFRELSGFFQGSFWHLYYFIFNMRLCTTMLHFKIHYWENKRSSVMCSMSCPHPCYSIPYTALLGPPVSPTSWGSRPCESPACLLGVVRPSDFLLMKTAKMVGRHLQDQVTKRLWLPCCVSSRALLGGCQLPPGGSMWPGTALSGQWQQGSEAANGQVSPLRGGPPHPVWPPHDDSPADRLTQPMGDPSHRIQLSCIQTPDRNWETINVCCLKPLIWGQFIIDQLPTLYQMFWALKLSSGLLHRPLGHRHLYHHFPFWTRGRCG